MSTLKAMWQALDNTGRIVLIVCIAIIVAASLLTGNAVDFSFLMGG
jgi:hypothetical protein